MIENPKADEKYNIAMEIYSNNPLESLKLLKEIADEYPDTFTVHNYVIPNILILAQSHELWNEAIAICEKAIIFYPSSKSWWETEKKAIEFDKLGKKLDGLEIRFSRDPKYSSAYVRYGNRFLELGANDRAWGVFNEAIGLAAKEHSSPHNIRQAMAKMVYKEKKYVDAMVLILKAICEAWECNKQIIPQSLISDLKKYQKANGLTDNGFFEDVINICKSNGFEKANLFFHTKYTYYQKVQSTF